MVKTLRLTGGPSRSALLSSRWWRHCALIAVAAAWSATAAHAQVVLLTLGHAYGGATGAIDVGTSVVHRQEGEFVDAGETRAWLGVRPFYYNRAMIDLHLDCARAADVVRAGEEITITAYGTRVAPMFFANLPACVTRQSVALGILPVGRYRVQSRVVLADGTSLPGDEISIEVLPLAGRCNARPQAMYTVAVQPAPPQTAEAFTTRLATDAALAAALDHPTVVAAPGWTSPGYVALRYAPLRDPATVIDLVNRTGEVASFERLDVPDWVTCDWWMSSTAAARSMVEFYREVDDRYFYTGDPREIAAIEAGAVGPGWARTGRSFSVAGEVSCAAERNLGVVYRFTGVPGVGPDTHFFTHDRGECHAVATSGRWQFEGVAFWAQPVLPGGICGSDVTQVGGHANVPLRRLWRPFGPSTHRFTTDPAVVAQMTARGWVDEGATMCVIERR